MDPVQFENLNFSEAARVWLEARAGKISAKSQRHYQEYLKPLNAFFETSLLKNITVDDMHTYQRKRQEEIRRTPQHIAQHGDIPNAWDGASQINHELGMIRQLLDYANLWERMRKRYEQLPLPREGPGVALDDEERAYIFTLARTNPRWMVAACAGSLCANTSAGPGEIKHLRLRDVDLGRKLIRIRECVKNEHRLRVIPLNDDAEAAIRWLMERAKNLGASKPEHFLFPHRAAHLGEKADPTRPMDSWKRAHYSLREAVAKKYPRLARMRVYDFRHTAGTNLMENPLNSEQTVERVMGHRPGSRIKSVYFHAHRDSMKAAVAGLSRGDAAALGLASSDRTKLQLVCENRPRPQSIPLNASCTLQFMFGSAFEAPRHAIVIRRSEA